MDRMLFIVVKQSLPLSGTDSHIHCYLLDVSMSLCYDERAGSRSYGS